MYMYSTEPNLDISLSGLQLFITGCWNLRANMKRTWRRLWNRMKSWNLLNSRYTMLCVLYTFIIFFITSYFSFKDMICSNRFLLRLALQHRFFSFFVRMHIIQCWHHIYLTKIFSPTAINRQLGFFQGQVGYVFVF